MVSRTITELHEDGFSIGGKPRAPCCECARVVSNEEFNHYATPSVGPSAATAAKMATVDSAGEPAPAADTTAAPTEEPFVPRCVRISVLTRNPHTLTRLVPFRAKLILISSTFPEY